MVVRLGTMIIVIIGEGARVLMMVAGSGRKGERSRGGVRSKEESEGKRQEDGEQGG
jgi:hypothetical protein